MPAFKLLFRGMKIFSFKKLGNFCGSAFRLKGYSDFSSVCNSVFNIFAKILSQQIGVGNCHLVLP